MGTAKALMPIGGRPMIAHVVGRLASGQLDSVIVVCGMNSAAVDAALLDHARDYLIVHNPDYATGEMLSSVKAGIGATTMDADAFLIALGDQPFVRARTIRMLLERMRQSHADVVRPMCRGRHGHPIVIAARCRARILALPRDQSLRTFINDQATSVLDVSVDDPATIQDIDTPQDYLVALAGYQRSVVREKTGAASCHLAQV